MWKNNKCHVVGNIARSIHTWASQRSWSFLGSKCTRPIVLRKRHKKIAMELEVSRLSAKPRVGVFSFCLCRYLIIPYVISWQSLRGWWSLYAADRICFEWPGSIIMNQSIQLASRNRCSYVRPTHRARKNRVQAGPDASAFAVQCKRGRYRTVSYHVIIKQSNERPNSLFRSKQKPCNP